MNEFETVATYTYAHECMVIKPLLLKEGIQHFFQNETIIGLIPFYSNAVGGIKLKVKKSDYQKVKAILNSLSDPYPHLKIV